MKPSHYLTCGMFALLLAGCSQEPGSATDELREFPQKAVDFSQETTGEFPLSSFNCDDPDGYSTAVFSWLYLDTGGISGASDFNFPSPLITTVDQCADWKKFKAAQQGDTVVLKGIHTIESWVEVYVEADGSETCTKYTGETSSVTLSSEQLTTGMHYLNSQGVSDQDQGYFNTKKVGSKTVDFDVDVVCNLNMWR